jgi:L,D-transpeptidase YbiS
LIVVLFAAATVYGYVLNKRQKPALPAVVKPETMSQKDLDSKRKSLEKKFGQLVPKGPYIVIDTGRNTLFLRKGSEVLRQAVISSGSGNVLEDPNGDRKWVFDTPRGAFTVKSKATDPSWIKPDWAFIEDGESIPKDWSLRVEEGVLGDYALGFGDGYFIHGTLYTRLLGRNVTHGCVRVGDEDLEAVFKVVSIGTPVFIF